jgi:hypothetical protein
MNLNFNERSYLSVIIGSFAMVLLMLPILLYSSKVDLVIPAILIFAFIQVLIYFLPRRKD